MGGVEGHKGAWAYVEGGMGGVSLAMAKAFKAAGGDIYCDAPVEKILISGQETNGVKLENGQTVEARTVLANPTAKITFEKLIDADQLPADFLNSVQAIGKFSSYTQKLKNIRLYITGHKNQHGSR